MSCATRCRSGFLRLVAALVLAAPPGVAQTPAPAPEPAAPGLARAADADAAWQTLRTEHFRIHFTPGAEPFARAVAARVEAVRGAVLAIVGAMPGRTIDLVVGAPTAASRATALPFAEGPRLVLHPQPPASASLTPFDDWLAADLARELTRLAHVARPPDGAVLRWATRILPLQALVRRVPSWVAPAYGASVAGRVAWAADPGDPFRVALLRAMTTSADLPNLAELGDDPDGMRRDGEQLVGAAFLGWLDARAGAGSMAQVWESMAEGFPRSFASAFRRSFGAPPAALYAAFEAELDERWGEVDAPAATGPRIAAASAPAVTATGELAFTVRGADGTGALEVHAQGSSEPTARLALPLVDVRTEPRWLADGTILFARPALDDDERRSDLYRWWPQTGRVERLTRGAGLGAPDPAPDGTWAVAVENRSGVATIVRVDLANGAVTPLVAGDVATVVDAPRVAPDGRRIAYLRHRGAGWRLLVLDVASGASDDPVEADFPVLAWPAWGPDGRTLAVTVGSGAAVRVEVWPLDRAPGEGAAPAPRTLSAPDVIAYAPAWDPANREWLHLALWPPGDDRSVRLVRVREAARSAAPRVGAGPAAGATPAPRAGPCLALDDARAPGEPYGRGSMTTSSLLAGAASPSARTYVSGYRAGDVIGRWELVAVAGISEQDVESGGIVWGAWRGRALPIELSGFSVDRRPSQQPEPVPGLGETLDVLERGVTLATRWDRNDERRALRLDTAVLATELTPLGAERVERYAAVARGTASWNLAPGAPLGVRVGTGVSGAAGWTDAEPWQRWGGDLRLGLVLRRGQHAAYDLDLTASVLRVEEARLVHDRLVLGGTPSSIVPPDLDLARIYEPALPAGTRIGDRWESLRVELGRSTLPVRLFAAHHQVSSRRDSPTSAASSDPDPLRLIGIAITLDRTPRPLFRLPGSRVRVGTAYILDEPFRHRFMSWAGIAWTL